MTEENGYTESVSRVYGLFSESAVRYAAVITFGCQQNEADSERMRGMARAMGYTLTEALEKCDLVLVNTCAIREHAEKRALSTIGQLKHRKAENRQMLIGVCGCMMAEEHRVEEIRRRYPYVDFTVEPSSLHKIPAIIYERLTTKKRVFATEILAPNPPVEGLPVVRTHPYRAYVSIMYGCNNFCSYCIVPYVRGRERSRMSADIIQEVRELVASGCRDITLLGQNVNSYRGDCDFAELLSRLDAIPGDYLLRFMTSHPRDVSDKLIDVMAHGTHIAHQFHLPVQSGSDRILRAMNRHYDLARYQSIVEKLRSAMPDIVLTSDVIVAFPGETEEEFEATLALLSEVQYDMIYSFIYSPRAGTPAAQMADAVPPDVASARMRRLLDTQDDIASRVARRYDGACLRVLSDGESKGSAAVYSGRTDGGRLVHFTAPAPHTGEFVRVKIERAEPFALYGTLIEE